MAFTFMWFILMLLSAGLQAAVVCQETFSCLDCHMLQVCQPQDISTSSTISLVNCSLAGGYCNPTTNSCTVHPPMACVPADNFTCLSDGYFPDPFDCRAFHLCDGLVSTRYDCDPALPSYYYYDVVLYRCVATAACTGYSCSDKTGIKVAHPVDKNLFAFCLNGSTMLQDRCPANYELDEDSQQCVAVCKTHGILPDVNDCGSFYRCVAQNGGYLQTREQCPIGQGLNPLTLECEESPLYCAGTGGSTTSPPLTTTTALPTTVLTHPYPTKPHSRGLHTKGPIH